MSWWVGHARAGREFEVRDAIASLGAFAWVAREFRTVRPPTKRRHVAVTAPHLARYVLIECTDEQWHELDGIKHLSPTMLFVSETAALRHLAPFMARIDADYAEREARFAAGEKLEAYQPGDLLRVLAGPLADQLISFEKAVLGAAEFEDKVKGYADLFGQRVSVTVDALHVMKVAAE